MLEAEVDEKTKPVEMIWDPFPKAGCIDVLDDQERDKDWARAGPAERLSAAGAAAPAPDASALHEGVNATGSWVYGVHFNPKGRPESVVHSSDHARLEALAKDWYGQAVGDGADAVRRDELDPWQKFAHDIVTGLPDTRDEAVRLMVLGIAGQGSPGLYSLLFARFGGACVRNLRKRFRTQHVVTGLGLMFRPHLLSFGSSWRKPYVTCVCWPLQLDVHRFS